MESLNNFKIRTEQFEGPLDLLLFLIQKNELDISSISIHKITDQYLQTIQLMRELNFDLASEFLVMAATLIHIKSKKLLPQDEILATTSTSELPETEEELIRRLKEYQQFQQMGKKMLDLPILNQNTFTRPNVPAPEKQTIWREMDITELTLVFQDVLKKSRKSSRIIIREPTSIPERIQALGKILKVNEMTEFASILTAEPNRGEIVVTFIALLELARLKKLKIYQNETFGSIYLTLTEPIDTFDAKLAIGFQYKAKEVLQ